MHKLNELLEILMSNKTFLINIWIQTAHLHCHLLHVPVVLVVLLLTMHYGCGKSQVPAMKKNGMVEINMHKVFKQTVGAEEIKQEWISCNLYTKKVHCYICLACSTDRNSPFFVNGLSTADVKHLYSRIHEHEKSKTRDKMCSYIMATKALNLSSHFLISHLNCCFKKSTHAVVLRMLYSWQRECRRVKRVESIGELVTRKQHTI